MYTRLLYARIRGTFITIPTFPRWCLTLATIIGMTSVWLLWWYLPATSDMQQLRMAATHYPSWEKMIVQHQEELRAIRASTEASFAVHKAETKYPEQHILQFIVSQAQNYDLQLQECCIDHHAAGEKGCCSWSFEGQTDQVFDYLQQILVSALPLKVEQLSLNWTGSERIHIQGLISPSPH